mmetsp:Transcript_172190/g.546636  ORF Transcript_172190/g.546636 Transcript_172190/m.546636 type:complete len:329 (+) Transcript_172190:136-1122(+)
MVCEELALEEERLVVEGFVSVLSHVDDKTNAIRLSAPLEPPLPLRLMRLTRPVDGGSQVHGRFSEHLSSSSVVRSEELCGECPPSDGPLQGLAGWWCCETDLPPEGTHVLVKQQELHRGPTSGWSSGAVRHSLGFFGVPGCFERCPFWLTTLCIQGLPDNCTQSQLLNLWAAKDSYNYLSVPFNSRQRRSTHYCFINFISAEAASSFFYRWDDQVLPLQSSRPGSQPLKIYEAKCQGLGANIAQLSKQHGPATGPHPALFLDMPDMSVEWFLENIDHLRPRRASHWEGKLEDVMARWDEAGRPSSFTRWEASLNGLDAHDGPETHAPF